MSEPQPSIVLRPAAEADAGEVARIWESGWRDGHLGNVPDELAAVRTPAEFRRRAAARIPATTVALAAGRVVGFVVVVADEVEQIYVAAAARGTGVADRLLSHAEAVIAAGGHERAWLAVVAGNARARAFYERRGWSDTGRFDYPADVAGGSLAVPAHRYAKRLRADA